MEVLGRELGIANLAILGVFRFFSMGKKDFFFVAAVIAKEQVGQCCVAWGAA